MHTLLHPDNLAAARSSTKRRVLIVDDHDFFAACLRTLLDNESDLIVCDIAGSASDLGERIARFQPDLLVIDLTLGPESGLQLGQRLREAGIDTPVLFISTLAKPPREQLEEIGHCAFSLKSRKPAEFLRTLREILGPRRSGGELPVRAFGLNAIKGKA